MKEAKVEAEAGTTRVPRTMLIGAMVVSLLVAAGTRRLDLPEHQPRPRARR